MVCACIVPNQVLDFVNPSRELHHAQLPGSDDARSEGTPVNLPDENRTGFFHPLAHVMAMSLYFGRPCVPSGGW